MANDHSSRTELIRALSLLRPSDGQGLHKRRLGTRLDGGYVVADDLENIHAAYSFGISVEVSFDYALAEAGIPVRMFDHTVEGPPVAHPNFSFHKQGLGPTVDPDSSLFTLEHHIRQCGDMGRTDMLLKLDIEGAEFDSLIAAGPGLLRSFRQIVIEIHWLQRLADPAYRDAFCRMMACLLNGFHLVHVHGNNCGPVVILEGLPVADVLELTFVRSDLIVPLPSSTVYPTPLDYANDHTRPDHLLWFFPFLPDRGEAAIQQSLVAALQSDQDQHVFVARMHLAAHENAVATLQRQIDDLERQRVALSTDLTLAPSESPTHG